MSNRPGCVGVSGSVQLDVPAECRLAEVMSRLVPGGGVDGISSTTTISGTSKNNKAKPMCFRQSAGTSRGHVAIVKVVDHGHIPCSAAASRSRASSRRATRSFRAVMPSNNDLTRSNSMRPATRLFVPARTTKSFSLISSRQKVRHKSSWISLHEGLIIDNQLVMGKEQ
jgi:hypothetical protein